MKSKRVQEVAVMGLCVGLGIACGGPAMDMASDAVGDAGTMMGDLGDRLMDAGASMMRDSGRAMRDAGDVLHDAGRVLKDASAGDGSASAQSCGSCTAGLHQMVVTADQDPTRHIGGSLQGDVWNVRSEPHPTEDCAGYELRGYLSRTDGPFFITDVRAVAGSADVYAVPSQADCLGRGSGMNEVCGNSLIPQPLYAPAPDGRAIAELSDGASISGARLWVGADEALCIFAEGTVESENMDPSTDNRVVWSGFRPYE